MTNRMKGVLGVGVFILSSVEQAAGIFYGRWFEQPIDPVVLLGIAGLVYAVQKFKTPVMEVTSLSRFIKLMIGCLLLSVLCVAFTRGASYMIATHLPTLSVVGVVSLVKSLASLAWCFATIAALFALRDAFTMK